MATFECPKCGTDISDTLEEYDPECGINGGYYCDACDESFPYEYDGEDDYDYER